MNQYCRYCAFCFEADGYRCSNYPKGKQTHLTEEQIKRPNKCPNFALSDLGDVITGKQYNPRTRPYIHGKGYEQITIDEIEREW